MFERISRGWGIAKSSWTVLKAHPVLLVYPVCSLAAFGVVFGAVGAVAYADSGFGEAVTAALEQPGQADPIVYVVLFVVYVVASFIGIFFNAALVACALEAFAGRTPTVAHGFEVAVKRLPQILGWSLVAATVGLLITVVQGVLRDKLGFLGALLGNLMDIAWAVVTYFVVPVLVVDGVGPVEAVKRSSAILKRTWGESLAGEGGLGIISFLLTLPACLVIGVAAMFIDASMLVTILVIAIAVVYLVVVSLVFAALNTIFRTGAYLYATTGTAPTSIDAELVQSAFHPK